MAYIGEDDYLSVWWPGPLPEDILAGSYLDFQGLETPGDGLAPPGAAHLGFILRGWFGPFLLSPSFRSPAGRC